MADEKEQFQIDTISENVTKTNTEQSLTFYQKVKQRIVDRSGIFYMLAANFIFACCTFVLKLIPADMFDIMIVRFLIQTIVFGCYASFYKHYNLFDTNKQIVACSLNILMSSGTNLTYLAAFYFLPLSDLNAIKYTYIVWGAILAVIFLKDRFKFVNGISIVLAFSGLVFATKPQIIFKHFTFLSANVTQYNYTTISTNTNALFATEDSYYYYVGVLFAFTSSLTKGIQIIARKQLVQKKQPYSVMNFQFTAFALVVAICYSLIRRYWYPEPYPWKWMSTAGVAIGCCQLVTNTFYAKALKRENVQLISILGTIDIIYACILQYIFMGLIKSWLFYVGATLIVISAIILSVDSYLVSVKQKNQSVSK